jgi:hypothetical protein
MPGAERRPEPADDRVRERAKHLWREAGRPGSGPESFLEEAKTILAIEDNPEAGRESLKKGYNNPGPWGEPVEEAKVALDNEGEFPTMTDQGEQQSPRAPFARPPSGN